MSLAIRKTLLGVLVILVGSALVVYAIREPSWDSFGMALLLIVIWTPVKGVLFRRLGGKRPYYSALAANASSELAGLPVHLALSFWPLMGVSFLVSGAIETLTLLVMATTATWNRALVLAFYGSLVVHLITAGWFASQRSLALGLPFLIAGIVLFHLPTFFTERIEEWTEESSCSSTSTRTSR